MSNTRKANYPWLVLGPPGTNMNLKAIQKPNRRRLQHLRRAFNVLRIEITQGRKECYCKVQEKGHSCEFVSRISQ